MKTEEEIRAEIERMLKSGAGGYESGYVTALDWVLKEKE